MISPQDIRATNPIIGGWQPIWSINVDFSHQHFETAIDNVIRNPGINSTILLRADFYLEYTLKAGILCNTLNPVDPSWLSININDKSPRLLELDGWIIDHYLVRRNVPRNPHRDAVSNQTCAVYTSTINPDDRLLTYYPHCSVDEMPFYLPKVDGVGILYSATTRTLSVHYLCNEDMMLANATDRRLRIGLHLLNTACKHSKGVQTGYKKRVQHDQIIARNAFQDRYIRLKQKYASILMDLWVENTDPCKHIYEDLGIAAFLIELWSRIFSSPFKFIDVGCGNGILVYILLMEGFKGTGIDIRERKSWKVFPEEVQQSLKTGIIMPTGLQYTMSDEALVQVGADKTHTKENTFIVGNHCDELTLWIPLLKLPFMVMPCCSHSLDGKRTRFAAGPENKSAYQALVEKTMQMARDVGWKPELEYLRIPSTRNAAIVGRALGAPLVDCNEIIAQVDGDQWVACAKKLQKTVSTH